MGSFNSGETTASLLQVGAEVWAGSNDGHGIRRFRLDGSLIGTINPGLGNNLDMIRVGNEVWSVTDNNSSVKRFGTSGTFIGSFGVFTSYALVVVGNEVWVAYDNSSSIQRYSFNRVSLGSFTPPLANGATYRTMQVVGSEVWAGNWSNRTVIKLGFDTSSQGSFVGGTNDNNKELRVVGAEVWAGDRTAPHLYRMNTSGSPIGVVTTGSSGTWAIEVVSPIVDCNTNAVNDSVDIAGSTSADCNSNAIPDECDIAEMTATDGDGDGVPDACDGCPADPGKIAPGVCGCGVPDIDTDSDGVLDCNDGCPNDPGKSAPGACGCGVPDDDGDSDGFEDCIDNCPEFASPNQADSDSDGAGDICDGCPADPEKAAPGLCGCGVLDDDIDSDTIPDCIDVCEGYDDLLDCNSNGTPDGCDITGGSSLDLCPANGVPDECESYNWAGLSGGQFDDPGNWAGSSAPTQGGAVMLVNTGSSDNECVLNTPGHTAICSITLRGTGSGRQILKVGASSDLLVAAAFENRPGGVLLARPLSEVAISAPLVSQAGELDIRAASGISFDAALVNSTGGLITLLGGTLAAGGLTNEAGADVEGAGWIDGNVINNGRMNLIADTLIAGDLENEGTITIQSGVLTVSGSLSGGGTIIGGFGGRDGDSTGLTIHGDFLPSSTDWLQLDLTHSTLQFDCDPADGPQHLEVMAPDQGARVTLPDATLYSIGTLRIGPSATTVRLSDNYDNKGAGSTVRRTREALYVRHIVLEPGVTLDLGGLHLYFETAVPADPFATRAGVQVIDSRGGGALIRCGSSDTVP